MCKKILRVLIINIFKVSKVHQRKIQPKNTGSIGSKETTGR